MTRPGLILSTLLFLGAIPAAAQETGGLRATGPEISVIPRKSSAFSGSLGIGQSRSAGLGATLYSGTLGGTLVPDKLWVFASAEQQTSRIGAAAAESAGAFGPTNAVDGKVLANLGDRQSLAALFSQSQPASLPAFGGSTIPASFLSMRYTGIVSESMFFTASVSRSSSSHREAAPASLAQ